MITIVDYGLGNLRSVQKALDKINTSNKISSRRDDIINAKKLILPGVGHFGKAIEKIKNNGLIDILTEAVVYKQIPILGICLGMQLMTEYSEEGEVEGFGWIKAKTIKFIYSDDEHKIPHMGWNNIIVCKDDNLYRNIKSTDLFYFVHSYYIHCEEKKDIMSETNYGCRFVSSFKKNNVYGCQFHPEKSYEQGITVLKNYVSDNN